MGPDLELECPHCGHPFVQNVRKITVKGKRSCPSCKETIEFSGSYIFRILRQLDPSRHLESPPDQRIHHQ